MKDSASSFPPEFASYRVLPSIVSALDYEGASVATILPLVIQLGENVALDEYPKLVLGPIIKLYSSPDRATRLALLEHLPEYVEKLDKKAVSDKIFPHFVREIQYAICSFYKKKNNSNWVSQILSPLSEKLR